MHPPDRGIRRRVEERADSHVAALISEHRSREVERLYKKKVVGGKAEKEKKTLVVGRKFQGGSAGKLPHNVKLVDRRAKSDARGLKAAARRHKGGKGKHGGAGGAGRKGSRQKKNKAYARSARK